MSYALIRITVLTLTYFTAAWMDTFSSIMRGLGFSLIPMIVSVFGVCGVRILWIALFFPLNPTYETAFYCFPVSWVLTALIHFTCFLFGFRRVKQKMQAEDAAKIPEIA
jgi:Na+-driven multidrug efflux pump